MNRYNIYWKWKQKSEVGIQRNKLVLKITDKYVDLIKAILFYQQDKFVAAKVHLRAFTASWKTIRKIFQTSRLPEKYGLGV